MPVARIDFGEVQDPQKVVFLNLTPLNLLQKPHFWSIFWLKVDLLADLGVHHPPSYGPGLLKIDQSTLQYNKRQINKAKCTCKEIYVQATCKSKKYVARKSRTSGFWDSGSLWT